MSIKGLRLSITPHCERGPATIKQTYHSQYMGKDWQISCPCGYKETFTWVYTDFAVQRWNERREDDRQAELGDYDETVDDASYGRQ